MYSSCSLGIRAAGSPALHYMVVCMPPPPPSCRLGQPLLSPYACSSNDGHCFEDENRGGYAARAHDESTVQPTAAARGRFKCRWLRMPLAARPVATRPHSGCDTQSYAQPHLAAADAAAVKQSTRTTVVREVGGLVITTKDRDPAGITHGVTGAVRRIQ